VNVELNFRDLVPHSSVSAVTYMHLNLYINQIIV
jgi:hypothetical protein